MKTPDEPIKVTACAAGCKRVTPSWNIDKSGWHSLQITGRWRCPDCSRELAAASAIVGMTDQTFVDALSADSRGALPKSTAHTISAPAKI